MTARRRRRTRRGSFLVETAMAALMLMVALTLITKVVGAVAAERRGWDRREVALAEVGNLIERLAARPYEELTPESVKGLALGPEAGRTLPGAELSAKVEDEPAGKVDARRVSVRLRWRNRSGDWDAPVELTTWAFRRKEGS